MEGPDRATATWFAGDLDDPWVVAIAEALPRDTLRLHCPADLPETWPIDRPTPASLVLHRATLSPIDAQRLTRLKTRADRTPRIVLCVGPQARYVDVERWSRLVDAVIPEATARETVGRQALAIERQPKPSGGERPKVAVVSQNYELRTTLAEAADSGGFAVEAISEPADAPPGLATAWDVPGLEPDWPNRLTILARSSPVVALLSFADRATVTLALQRGALACLDLPCEVADLLVILDRLVTLRTDRGHEVPPQPVGKRVLLSRKN